MKQNEMYGIKNKSDIVQYLCKKRQDYSTERMP